MTPYLACILAVVSVALMGTLYVVGIKLLDILEGKDER